MTRKKPRKLSGLTKSLLRTAKDIYQSGIMDKRGFDKIAKRHVGTAATSTTRPITPKEIRALRVKAKGQSSRVRRMPQRHPRLCLRA